MKTIDEQITELKQLTKTAKITDLSKALGVSPNGFYSWVKRPLAEQKLKKIELQKAIEVEYGKHNGMAGSPLITKDLKEIPKWKSVSRTRVSREMKALGIQSKTRKKWTVTTNSDHNEPVAENILNRKFDVKIPNRVWVSDLTYIRVKSHWAYLVVFIDLFNRKVVGWDLSSSLETKSTLKAFRKAIWNRKPHAGLLVHSDQGVQYASKDFRNELAENKCIQSMSRRGNCWDNAPSESFFSTFKTRLTHHRNYDSMSDLKRDVFWYIEIYYNRYRKHSSNNWVSPEQKELDYITQKQKVA